MAERAAHPSATSGSASITPPPTASHPPNQSTKSNKPGCHLPSPSPTPLPPPLPTPLPTPLPPPQSAPQSLKLKELQRPSVPAQAIATRVALLPPTPSSPKSTTLAARRAKSDGKKQQQDTVYGAGATTTRYRQVYGDGMSEREKKMRRIPRDDQYDVDDEYGGQDPAFDQLVATVELDDNDRGEFRYLRWLDARDNKPQS